VIKLFKGSCVDKLRDFKDGCVDLTVTSPPYDNLKDYLGNISSWCEESWKSIIKDLYRVTSDGGVVVWVVNDATIDGGETGSSFKQALWAVECGFKLETMIWEKIGSGCFGSNKLYAQNFEYMFIFIKGKPTRGKLILDRKNKTKPGTVMKVNANIQTDGSSKYQRTIVSKEFGKRNNIWTIDTERKVDHPAPFPLQLAKDHIISWSNEGDTVLDPFMGSGTTGIAAKLLNRSFLGIELADEYFDMAKERIEGSSPLSKFL
jgi:site-specific DNA-methyltransferase (adenine-specific)